MNSEIELEVSNLTRRFAAVTAVDCVSLQIKRGEFLTLLGPSGCGKTTLLRIIAGFERPDEGRVFLCGEDITDLPPYKRDVCTVFQHYALFPHLNVFQNVAFGLQRRRLPKSEIKQKVEAALQMVQLTGYEMRSPKQLSGGQQQRVAIARALVLQPRVLLLDEPLGALDRKLRQDMQTELKSLQRRLGITFIFVTHDQEEALSMSDRIAVINHGRIEQLGPPLEIYERPRTEFTATFIGISNIFEAEIEKAQEDGAWFGYCGNRFVARAEGPLVEGQKIKIAIRPEKLLLSTKPLPDFPNSLPVIIADRVYSGASTEWLAKASDGKLIAVYQQNQAPAISSDDFTIGQMAFLNWSQESSIILEADKVI